LAIPDAFVEHATQQELRHASGIDKDAILAAARELVGKEGNMQ
jgi:deoxyxylulose-5-phosphate synthase